MTGQHTEQTILRCFDTKVSPPSRSALTTCASLRPLPSMASPLAHGLFSSRKPHLEHHASHVTPTVLSGLFRQPGCSLKSKQANKGAAPNSRPASPFRVSGNSFILFCAQPRSPAAVGELGRSADAVAAVAISVSACPFPAVGVVCTEGCIHRRFAFHLWRDLGIPPCRKAPLNHALQRTGRASAVREPSCCP